MHSFIHSLTTYLNTKLLLCSSILSDIENKMDDRKKKFTIF